ncbi:DUF1302 domain-containing protein [Aquabacterium sp.]|uniref:DUF1302 domain-containing protein n=1 Tax=Aquabacterium sp. TaxID=1872578 RepID=UPI002C69CFA0|nr:DUF1302 family protein [Aquabacterium sp.]HSW03554.1 DUF1302 family protein [Aquabacterium sp.]
MSTPPNDLQPLPARLGPRCRLAAAAAALCSAHAAMAIEIDTGIPELSLRWDNTVRYNISVRAEKIDPAIGTNATTDESDNKFGRGDVVNNRVDLLTELDLVYQRRMGLRITAAAWYDHGYHDHSVASGAGLQGRGSYTGNTYSSSTKRFYNGPSGEFLDAFVFGNFDVGGMPVRVKLGKHSIFWGDVAFNANHSVAYSQMPTDTRKQLGSPGIEAKETVLPLNQVSGQIQFTDTLALAGQYFLDWKPNRLPEGGTYYGAADFLFEGPDRFSYSPAAPAAARAAPLVPERKRGNWGLNLKWSPEWVDGTIGVYYRKFDERQPFSAPQLNPAAGFYRLVFAQGTELVGLGLNKNLGGVAVAAEVSKRMNTAFVNNSGIDAATNAGPRGDSYHAFINGTVLGNLGASVPFTAVAELVFSRWDKLKSNPGNQFKAEGFPGCNVANAGFSCVTKNYTGISLLFAPKILQVIPGGDLSLPLFLGYGLKGNAATLSGGNQDAGNYSIGAQLDYLQRYTFGLTYSDFFGRYRTNPATGALTVANGALYKDRGLLAFSFKTSF